MQLIQFLLTCGNDVEDAGLVCLLVADHVGSPAEEGPEVHVRVGSVADEAPTRAGGVAGGREEGGGEGVVEGPGEGVRLGEAPHAAAHSDRLVLGDSVDDVLPLVTHGAVCKGHDVNQGLAFTNLKGYECGAGRLKGAGGSREKFLDVFSLLSSVHFSG